MKLDKQLTMFELLITPMKKTSDDRMKSVEKQNVVAPRKVGYIVHR